MFLCASGVGEFFGFVDVWVVGGYDYQGVHLGHHAFVSSCTRRIECLMQEIVSFVAISIEWDVGVLVLEFVRATIAMSYMNTDDHSVGSFRGLEMSAILKLSDALLNVSGVCVGEGEEGFVPCTGEVKHGLLAVDFHFASVFIGFVEGAAEGVGGCCGGDDKVTGVVGAGEHFVARRGPALGHWWWLEEIGVFAVCPSRVIDKKKPLSSFLAKPYAVHNIINVLPRPASAVSNTNVILFSQTSVSINCSPVFSPTTSSSFIVVLAFSPGKSP